MSDYNEKDFQAVLEHPDCMVRVDDVEAVLAAWGVRGEVGAEWEGGFLLRKTSTPKPWAYVVGWCESEGWGEHDGVRTYFFDNRPFLDDLDEPTGTSLYGGLILPQPIHWVEAPANLNAWLGLNVEIQKKERTIVDAMEVRDDARLRHAHLPNDRYEIDIEVDEVQTKTVKGGKSAISKEFFEEGQKFIDLINGKLSNELLRPEDLKEDTWICLWMEYYCLEYRDGRIRRTPRTEKKWFTKSRS